LNQFLIVGFGGALGAMARHGIQVFIVNRFATHLVGTFLVNTSGSFLLGIFVGFGIAHIQWPSEIRNLFAIGFLGSYTTFSTLSVGTIQLVQKGEILLASINLSATVLCGIAVAAIGVYIGRLLSPT
jgi:CrcB protein